MKTVLVFVFLIHILTSCERGNRFLNSRPVGVISEKHMADVLVDIHLAESALRVGNTQKTMPGDSTYQRSQFLEVFDKHRITPDEFRKSLSYYAAHISKLDEIYTEVIDRLNQMESELRGKVTEIQADTTKSGKPKINKVNLHDNQKPV